MFLLGIQTWLVIQTQSLILCSYKVVWLSSITIPYILTGNSPWIMLLLLCQSPLQKKILFHQSSPLWKIARRKQVLPRTSHMLSRTSILLTYLIFTYLKMLPTLLHLKLKMHEEWIQNKSISWDIPRVGGMRSVVLHWATIEWQEVLKIGKYPRTKNH